MKKFYQPQLIMLLFFSVATLANLSGQNLFINPDFETGVLAPWQPGPENNAVISADAQEGNWAAKGHLEYYIDSLEEGATYFWIAQAKCLADCGSSNMWLGIRDMAGDSLITNYNFTNHTDYDTVSITFTAGAGDHRFFQWGQNGGEYISDNHVLFKEGTANIEEALAEARKIQISTTDAGVLINLEASIRTADILIHDLTGKLIYTQTGTNGNVLIDQSEFSISGIYVVTVKTDKTRKLGKVSIAVH